MSNKFFSNEEKNIQIKKFLDKKIDKYGDIKYAFVVMNKRKLDDMFIISNMANYFSDIYLKNGHQNIDPIISISLNRVSPHFWETDESINSQWRIFRPFEAVKPYYAIVSGQTFILHTPRNTMALLSLYANRFLNPEIVKDIILEQYEIQGVLIQCYDMLMHLYAAKTEKNKFDIDLTYREKEILYWISQGKTYPETAIILNIAVRTVKFHVASIVRKLGVNNAKHAIKLCEEMKLIPDMSGK